MDDIKKREMEKDCIKLIQEKISKKMLKEEFYSALITLQQKYPLPEHTPPYTPFQLKNYYTIQEKPVNHDLFFINKETKEVNYIEFLSHLQPCNFKEAGEMFIRHSNKMEILNENLPQLL